MGLRIYVAGRIVETARAKATAASLRMDGHTVASRWHDLGEHPAEHTLSRSERQFICSQNMMDLRHADTLLLLAHPEIKGALVELGRAWAEGLHVVAVGDPAQITLMADLHGVAWFATTEDARLELQRRLYR